MAIPKDAYLDAKIAARNARLAQSQTPPVPAPPAPPADPVNPVKAALDPVAIVTGAVDIEREFAAEPGATLRQKARAFFGSSHAMTLLAGLGLDVGAGAIGALPANEAKLIAAAGVIALAVCQGVVSAAATHATILSAAPSTTKRPQI